jgi:DNA ligase (NAD+)
LALQKGIGIGAKVEISRRNDVIPYIESVLVPGNKPIEAPKHCPTCGGNVDFEVNADGKQYEALICLNPDCKMKVFRSIMTWITSHNCKGISQSTIELLYEQGIIKNLVDFLKLPNERDIVQKLKSIDGFGDRKIEILFDNINLTKKTTYSNLLTGLDFSGIGRKTIDKLLVDIEIVTRIEDVFDFIKSGAINNVKDLGPTTINTLRNAVLKNESTYLQIASLVQIDKVDMSVGSSTKLKDLSFCFTGTLNTMLRPEAEALVVKNGGKLGGVNKKLSYLVTNDSNSGSGKNAKAKELGVKVIDEAQFLKLLEN